MLVASEAGLTVTLFTDASCKDVMSVSVYMALQGIKFIHMKAECRVGLTSTDAEILAVIKGINYVSKIGYKNIEVHSDNQIVVDIINKVRFKAKPSKMARALRQLCLSNNITAVKVKGHTGKSPQDICGNLALRLLG